MLLKRALALLALMLGLLGVVACIAGICAARLAGTRLDRANEKVFAAVDTGLASAQDRLRGVQERVEKSKITTAEIARSVGALTTRTAKERLESKLEIDGRAEKLAARLREADSWLETSAESVRGAQRVLELGNSLGAPLDPAALEEVLKELASLRDALQQAEQAVEGIGRPPATPEGEAEENRLSGLAQLLGRAVLTMSEIDTRLEKPISRLSNLQTDGRQLKARTSNYILLATVGCYLLLAWMAAGQAALCLCGWRNCRRSRPSA